MTLAILTVCTIIGRPAVDCVPAAPPLQEMPIVTTFFYPALGGVNCDLECDWMSLAPVTNEMYGYASTTRWMRDNGIICEVSHSLAMRFDIVGRCGVLGEIQWLN